jgi:hypothetical protein
MSCSEDETNAASVLSQMSQTAQPSENVTAQPVDNSVIAHQCDVETTSNQGEVLFFRNKGERKWDTNCAFLVHFC